MRIALSVVSYLLFFGFVWSFGRMACDELSLRGSVEYHFATDSHVDEWNCSSGLFTDMCSGVLDTPKSSVPVRYTCDKEHCQFECGK